MVDTRAGEILSEGVGLASPLSIDQLFLGAEPIVQIVVILLVLASFFCWAIIFSKTILLRKARKMSALLEQSFWRASSLNTFRASIQEGSQDPIAKLFLLAMDERENFQAVYPQPTSEDLQLLDRRMYRSMGAYLRTQMDRLEKHMTFLATVGSTAPFVGLFGTVWGIMHSFQAIAASKNTSLAVVAPGLAEALFATALGLVAAIPAVMAYNKISNSINGYALTLENFMDELAAIIQHNAMQKK